jgi:hypothetical protein
MLSRQLDSGYSLTVVLWTKAGMKTPPGTAARAKLGDGTESAIKE